MTFIECNGLGMRKSHLLALSFFLYSSLHYSSSLISPLSLFFPYSPYHSVKQGTWTYKMQKCPYNNHSKTATNVCAYCVSEQALG